MLTLTLAAVAAVASLAQLLVLADGARRVPALADVPPAAELPAGAADPPLVSVVVAARDEADTIAAGLASLRGLAGVPLEIVVVDDRSADGTGAAAARAAAGDPRVRLTRVDALPPGWLGKTHALARGAETARGEWLLFTDADVVFAPDALRRLLALAGTRGADHVTAGPDLELRTWPLALAVNYFLLAFLLAIRPWRAADPRAREAVGVGACNFVRASSYRAAGGHAPVRLRPDDDVALGRVLKRAGARQLFARSGGVLRVAWYDSFGAFARGLEKNAFAGMEYRPALAVLGVAATLVGALGPVAGALLAAGAARWLFAAAVLAQAVAYGAIAWRERTRAWLAPLYPAAAVLFAWVVARAVWLTVRRGGIAWRGTFYPLAELRANRLE